MIRLVVVVMRHQIVLVEVDFGGMEKSGRGTVGLECRDFILYMAGMGRNAPPALFFDWGLWGY